MPVSEQKFALIFSRMEGLLNWNASKNTRDWWFEEVRQCDHNAFDATIEQLAQGQKRPVIADFWSIYRSVKGQYVKQDKKYCGHCLDGIVEFYQEEPYGDTIEKREFVARCAFCWQGDKTNILKMDPTDKSIDWVRAPARYNASKVEVAQKRQEDIEKIKRGMGLPKPNKAIEGDRERHKRNTERQADKDEGYDPDLGEYVGRSQSPYSGGRIPF